MKNGNYAKWQRNHNICKVSNTSYFAVDIGHYCIINYYAGKLIINIDGSNNVIVHDGDVVNYGIHRDEVSGKWLIILENSAGNIRTFVLNGKSIDYYTDSIKYECQLNSPCISNSTIFIPIDSKIRGFNYKKSVFKDFECGVVSKESNLIKEKNLSL